MYLSIYLSIYRSISLSISLSLFLSLSIPEHPRGANQINKGRNRREKERLQKIARRSPPSPPQGAANMTEKLLT